MFPRERSASCRIVAEVIIEPVLVGPNDGARITLILLALVSHGKLDLRRPRSS